MGGCDNVLRLITLSSIFFGDQTSCYAAHFCSTSVTKLHVTLHTSVVLRWAHFMLRCTLLLYFGDQTSCYVARFCCTSVNTLHVTLHTSVVLRWTHFMLRCALMLHFGEHTSCYVVHVWVLWTTPKANLQRLRAVSSEAAQRCLLLAHTGTIDSCWKACKKMLPGSLSSQSPTIMTHVKAWQWQCAHRNADVCDITAKMVRKLKWWKRIAGAVAKRKTIPKT